MANHQHSLLALSNDRERPDTISSARTFSMLHHWTKEKGEKLIKLHVSH